jgi:hypothetical protein
MTDHSPLRFPASPVFGPIVEMSWHGKPPAMTSKRVRAWSREKPLVSARASRASATSSSCSTSGQCRRRTARQYGSRSTKQAGSAPIQRSSARSSPPTPENSEPTCGRIISAPAAHPSTRPTWLRVACTCRSIRRPQCAEPCRFASTDERSRARAPTRRDSIQGSPPKPRPARRTRSSKAKPSSSACGSWTAAAACGARPPPALPLARRLAPRRS